MKQKEYLFMQTKVFWFWFTFELFDNVKLIKKNKLS